MEFAIAEKLDPSQVTTFEEALRRVLVRKGLLTNEEVLEEVKVLIPTAYLSQISQIRGGGSGKRIWKNGKKLATKPEKEQQGKK